MQSLHSTINFILGFPLSLFLRICKIIHKKVRSGDVKLSASISHFDNNSQNSLILKVIC